MRIVWNLIAFKPVYEQLKRLIHQEWETTLQGTTDRDGRFTFRGFSATIAWFSMCRGVR